MAGDHSAMVATTGRIAARLEAIALGLTIGGGHRADDLATLIRTFTCAVADERDSWQELLADARAMRGCKCPPPASLAHNMTRHAGVYPVDEPDADADAAMR